MTKAVESWIDVIEKSSIATPGTQRAVHGLQTRLLDWTYSSFVAMHFVTENLDAYDRDSVPDAPQERLSALPRETDLAADHLVVGSNGHRGALN